MDVDETLLGPRPSLAPGSFRSFTSPPHPVSLSFIPVIVPHEFDCVILCSDPPAWKRLVSHPLPPHERIYLITTIFSDRGEVEVVAQLSGADAQTFIDILNEVSTCTHFPAKNDRSTVAKTPTLCWLGVGQPPTADSQEVFAHFI